MFCNSTLHKHPFGLLITSLVVAILCRGVLRAESASSRPNMVLFLSDDHTWRDSSVYGSPDVETPNMQRLADAGMTFDRA